MTTKIHEILFDRRVVVDLVVVVDTSKTSLTSVRRVLFRPPQHCSRQILKRREIRLSVVHVHSRQRLTVLDFNFPFLAFTPSQRSNNTSTTKFHTISRVQDNRRRKYLTPHASIPFIPVNAAAHPHAALRQFGVSHAQSVHSDVPTPEYLPMNPSRTTLCPLNGKSTMHEPCPLQR